MVQELDGWKCLIALKVLCVKRLIKSIARDETLEIFLGEKYFIWTNSKEDYFLSTNNDPRSAWTSLSKEEFSNYFMTIEEYRRKIIDDILKP